MHTLEVIGVAAGVVISPAEAVLTQLGERVTFSGSVVDSRGNATGDAVTFSVADSRVLADLGGGTYEAVGGGQTTVRAEAAGTPSLFAEATVVVNLAPVALVIEPGEVVLTSIGETLGLDLIGFDAEGTQIFGLDASWSSTAPETVAVDQRGVVVGLEAGEAVVTAEVDGLSAEVLVVVDPRVASLTIEPLETVLTEIGATLQYTAVARDAGGTELPDAPLSWSSENEAVATIDDAGLATAVGGGETVVTVASGEASAIASLQVRIPVVSVEIDPTSATIETGSEIRFTATAFDETGAAVEGIPFEFTSSDSRVLIMFSGGLALGNGPGEAVVTATEPGGLSAEAQITVEASPPNLELLAELEQGFLNWFNGTHYQVPGTTLSVMGDQGASSWGNFGMNDLRREPREPFDNDPSYFFSYVAKSPWDQMYVVLWSMRDVLREILYNPSQTTFGPAAEGWAYLMQGMALGTLGQLFDQAFVIDENVNPGTETLQPYTALEAAAQAKLSQAIAFANSNGFNVPSNWAGGVAYTNQDVARFAYSLRARFAATTARTTAERDAANWAQIATDIALGITADWNVISTGDCSTCFSDWTKTYGGSFSLWVRADVRMIGPADQSGAFQSWLATPVQDRDAILIDTDDRRVTNGGSQTNGLYFSFEGLNSSQFRPERGTYDFSDYRPSRFDNYAATTTGPAAIMNLAEMELTRAEALYRQGDLTGALAIINQRRTALGQLPAATTTGVSGVRCTPRRADGTCGDLLDVLKYEKRMEVWQHGMGIHYFDDRGWGDLVQGTVIQFPVPGAVLQELGLPIYTFGGVGQTGGAPVSPQFGLDPAQVESYWSKFLTPEARNQLLTEEVLPPIVR